MSPIAFAADPSVSSLAEPAPGGPPLAKVAAVGEPEPAPVAQRRRFEPQPEARSEDMVTIEVLGAAHAAAYRALRLEGLRHCPTAFRHALEEEAEATLAEVERRLETDLVFGAFAGGTLVGIAGLRFDPLRKKRHKGTLFGVYVATGARGEGIGTRLVEAAMAAAHGRVEQIHATVVTDALPARRLYEKLGFVEYGIEPRGLKVGGRAFDQALLVLMLA